MPISLNAGSRRNLTFIRRRCHPLPSGRERRLARRRHRNTGRERPPERTWGHVSRSRGGSLTPQMLCTDIWRGGINRRHSTSGTEHDAANTSSGYGTSCRESMQLAGGMSLMPRGLRRARSQGGLSSPSAVSSPLSPPATVHATYGPTREGDGGGDNSIPSSCLPLCPLPAGPNRSGRAETTVRIGLLWLRSRSIRSS